MQADRMDVGASEGKPQIMQPNEERRGGDSATLEDDPNNVVAHEDAAKSDRQLAADGDQYDGDDDFAATVMTITLNAHTMDDARRAHQDHTWHGEATHG